MRVSLMPINAFPEPRPARPLAGFACVCRHFDQLFVKPRVSRQKPVLPSPAGPLWPALKSRRCSVLTPPPPVGLSLLLAAQPRFSKGASCGAPVAPGGWVMAAAASASGSTSAARSRNQAISHHPDTSRQPPCYPLHRGLGSWSRRLPGSQAPRLGLHLRAGGSPAAGSPHHSQLWVSHPGQCQLPPGSPSCPEAFAAAFPLQCRSVWPPFPPRRRLPGPL